MEEGKSFLTILSGSDGTVTNTTRLSRRSYSVTMVNQQPSGRTGTNILCYEDPKILMTGAVVFVGCKINELKTEVLMAETGD